MTIRLRHVATTAIAVTAIFVGSSGAALAREAPPTSTVPSGYRAVTVKQAGVSFQLPITWLKINPGSEAFAKAAEKTKKLNPDYADAIDSVISLSDQIKFLAFDPDPAVGGVRTNMFIFPTPLDSSELRDPNALAASLEAQGMADVLGSKVKIGSVSAALVTGHVEVNAPTGRSDVYQALYFVPVKGELVLIAFQSGNDPTQDPTVQTVVRTLHLVH